MLKHHMNEHSNKAQDINTRNTALDESHKSVNDTNATFESNHMQNHATSEDTRKVIRQETAVKQRKRNTTNDINFKLTLMVFLIAMTSFVSMMPYCLMTLVHTLKRYESPWWIQLISNTTAINSSLNPFIIGYCNSEFRVYVKNVIRCRNVQ
ncbi:hypothetical protein DPMN_148395 [Dreissena polymorpha]|uniref:G-protein coupled receptors family 1 profile domain-containing protein n=1 Tax=Dreissena polymorpha TaxID=45954 RepID=A0A9D4J4B0_DREPO|nr:hypothetical protein DPMN_148395 [Dreissena polymorpha]